MAERRFLRRRRLRPEVALSAVAIGAVTASVGAVSAQASPDYPTWDEIQDAKGNEATKQAEIDALDALLTGLETAAADASRQQAIADEQYRIAQDALSVATTRAEELAGSAADAEERAKVSKMRAGLLAAHLSRSVGADLGLTLSLDGDSDGLLYQLSAMGKLSEQSATIYAAALADRNLATSLREQAESAKAELQRVATDAEKALTAANSAASGAQAALAEQEARQGELLAQLATLKDTTAEAEAAYRRSLAEERQSQVSASAPAPSAPRGGGSGGTNGGSNTGGGTSGGGTAPAPAAPAPAASAPAAPAPAAPAPAPAPAPPAPAPVGNPSPSAVATAISYARSQIGEPYQLNGAGPDRWDCSGLTLMAYRAAGVSIGTHSATNQYNTAKARGQLVPFSQKQPGDLLFWTSGYDMYHVAIYTGGGMMIEAPSAGKNVRERSIWDDGSLVGWVARPTA
ncbi:NlpC/P60 family protein [Naasia sp. SYSU D00057]|uniref:C40 family peptidase n=1 Tax=Naasia sp. SYSU D00057 TaxID=2817380 RepID=UPI001FED6F86|nr:NlpC/P60 family protein [Naasia sp. SYSU D00057]